MRWAGLVTCIGNTRYAYKILVGKPERKGQLVIPGRRWEDIKMNLKEIVREYVFIHLAQDRAQFTGFCEHGNKTSCSIKWEIS
jgi:hypothetical protein